MTPADLQILLQRGESTTLEFKERLTSSSFARELVARANTIGGRILLGVRNDGTVTGVKDSNALRARIQDAARDCDPPVKVLAEPIRFGCQSIRRIEHIADLLHRIGIFEMVGPEHPVYQGRAKGVELPGAGVRGQPLHDRAPDCCETAPLSTAFSQTCTEPTGVNRRVGQPHRQ